MNWLHHREALVLDRLRKAFSFTVVLNSQHHPFLNPHHWFLYHPPYASFHYRGVPYLVVINFYTFRTLPHSYSTFHRRSFSPHLDKSVVECSQVSCGLGNMHITGPIICLLSLQAEGANTELVCAQRSLSLYLLRLHK